MPGIEADSTVEGKTDMVGGDNGRKIAQFF
jgi:hypothetical protein